MNIEEKIKSLKEKNSEISRLKNEAYSISREVFEGWCKDVFDKNPRLESFSWNQYTPYFNDGDTCVFSANTDYLKINGEYADDSDWISENTVTSWGTYNRETKKYEGRVEVPNESYDAELDKVTQEIKDFLCLFDDDFYIRKFGDHSEITVTKEGIEVEEYEHD